MSTISDNFDIFECDFRPINRNLVVQKCVTAEQDMAPDGKMEYMDGGIIIPDTTVDTTQWVKILLVADDCKYFKPEHQFMFTMAPEYSNNLRCIDWEQAIWLVKEEETAMFAIDSLKNIS